MAKEQKQEQAPAIEAPEALGPPKSYRLHIMIGLAGLLLFQTFVLYMSLPRQPPPEYRGGLDPRNGPRLYESVASEPPTVMPTVQMTEILLRDKPFKVRTPRNVDEIEDIETFSLTMHVKVRKKEESKFTTRYNECKNEVIDRITGVLMVSTSEERMEPGHTTIKEKSKQAINEVLRVPYVQQVMVSEVNYEP